jgi:hypothetical protein
VNTNLKNTIAPSIGQSQSRKTGAGELALMWPGGKDAHRAAWGICKALNQPFSDHAIGERGLSARDKLCSTTLGNLSGSKLYRGDAPYFAAESIKISRNPGRIKIERYGPVILVPNTAASAAALGLSAMRPQRLVPWGVQIPPVKIAPYGLPV